MAIGGSILSDRQHHQKTEMTQTYKKNLDISMKCQNVVVRLPSNTPSILFSCLHSAVDGCGEKK